MIIFSNLDGTLKEIVPSNITQGSNKVDSVYLVVPSASAFTSVNAYFDLPEGTKLGPYLMDDPVAVHVDEDTTLLAYEYILDSGVTNFPGTVDVSFNLLTGSGDDAEIIGTVEASFEVLKSTLPVLPDAPAVDVYNLILAAYNNLKGRVSNLETTVAKLPTDFDTKLNAHNTSLVAHQNIQNKIKTDYEAFTTSSITAHNTSSTSHQDLRESITNIKNTTDKNTNGIAENTKNISKNTNDIKTNTDNIAENTKNITKLSTDVKTADSKADQAQTTANRATTMAQTAQATANEALSLAKNAPKNISYSTYNDFVTGLNSKARADLSVGISVYILEKDVPDVWVSSLSSSPATYSGTKSEFIEAINAGTVNIGYAVVASIESDIPDISNMVTTDTNQDISGLKNFIKLPQYNGHNFMTNLDRFIEDIKTGTIAKEDGYYNYTGGYPTIISNIDQVSRETVLIATITKTILEAAKDSDLVKIGGTDFVKIAGDVETDVTIKDIKQFMDLSTSDVFTVSMRVNRKGLKYYLYGISQPSIRIMTGAEIAAAITNKTIPDNQLMLASSASYLSGEPISINHLYRNNKGTLEDLTAKGSLDYETHSATLSADDFTAITEVPVLLELNGVGIPKVTYIDTDEAPVAVRGYFKDLMSIKDYPGNLFSVSYYIDGTSGKTACLERLDQMLTDGNGRKYRGVGVFIGNKASLRIRIYEDSIVFCAANMSGATFTTLDIKQLYVPGFRIDSYNLQYSKAPLRLITIDNDDLLTAKTAGILARYDGTTGSNATYFYSLHKPAANISITWSWYTGMTTGYGIGSSSHPIYDKFDIGLDKFDVVTGGASTANIAPIQLDYRTIGTDIDGIYFNTKLTTQEIVRILNYNFDTAGNGLRLYTASGAIAAVTAWGHDATVGTYLIMYGATGLSFTAMGLWSEFAGTLNSATLGSITFPSDWNTTYINVNTGTFTAAAFDGKSIDGFHATNGSKYFDTLFAGSEFTNDYNSFVMDSLQFANLDTVVLTDKEASAWLTTTESDISALGYGYYGEISYNNGYLNTEDYMPYVVPVNVQDIVDGNFAPFAKTVGNGIRVYAKTQPSSSPKFNITLTHAHLNN